VQKNGGWQSFLILAALTQEKEKEEGHGGKAGEEGREGEEAGSRESGSGDDSDSGEERKKRGRIMVAVKIEKGEEDKIKQKGNEDSSINTKVSGKKPVPCE
jgi:hypothetical protein